VSDDPTNSVIAGRWLVNHVKVQSHKAQLVIRQKMQPKNVISTYSITKSEDTPPVCVVKSVMTQFVC